MKYSEFKERIENRLGFKAEYSSDSIVVIHFGHVVAYVTKRRQYDFTVSSNIITPDEARYLAHQCHELACTPIDEREEEKKYKIRHKCLGRMGRYLNYYKIDNSFFFASDIDGFAVRTIFTKSQLEELMHDDFYKTLLDSEIYDWEVVE